MDLSQEAIAKLLDGVTEGRAVQFHGSYCKEAEGTPFTEWDTSHDVSVIRPDGSRYRVAHFRHAIDAGFYQTARELVPALAARLAEVEARAEAADAALREIATGRDANGLKSDFPRETAQDFLANHGWRK